MRESVKEGLLHETQAYHIKKLNQAAQILNAQLSSLLARVEADPIHLADLNRLKPIICPRIDPHR